MSSKLPLWSLRTTPPGSLSQALPTNWKDGQRSILTTWPKQASPSAEPRLTVQTRTPLQVIRLTHFHQHQSDRNTGSCAPLDTVLAGTLATLLKRNADSNTCTGTSGSQNGVSYTFYTAPDGNCKTTAEQGTIEGGLNRYFSYLGNQVCGIHCVRLDHGVCIEWIVIGAELMIWCRALTMLSLRWVRRVLILALFRALPRILMSIVETVDRTTLECVEDRCSLGRFVLCWTSGIE